MEGGTEQLFAEAQERMDAIIAATRRDFASVRTGRANPSLLDRVEVEYYGTRMPLNQLATISAPEPRMLVIQVYDKSAIGAVEKAILKADLGLTPSNDGQVIRLVLPQLTEERRKELVRVVRKMAEEKRVAVRNARRDVVEAIRKAQKNGELSEDDARRAQESVQELTDRYVSEVDELLKAKEREIMEV